DRHSPALFFLEPVGIDAGKGFHQCALAVVDVACGAYDEESTRFTIDDSLFALFRASTITVSSPGSNVLMSNSTASSSILLNTGGRRARRASAAPAQCSRPSRDRHTAGASPPAPRSPVCPS